MGKQICRGDMYQYLGRICGCVGMQVCYYVGMWMRGYEVAEVLRGVGM